MAAPEKTVELKRELGLLSATNFIVGTMIGSGIFVSASSALAYAGSVGMSLVVWTACGVISFLGALVYAELGTVVPRSGSEYIYLKEAFGKMHPFWGPLPAFIYSFVVVIFVRPVEVVVIILTSAEYIVELIKDFVCIDHYDNIELAKKCIAFVQLSIITYINASNVKLYTKVQNIFTFLKVLVCVVIIGIGLYELCKGNVSNISTGFLGTNYNPKNIALAFYSGLWAYDGWACITSVAEEIKNPEVNILRSILLSVPFVTVFYVLMNISYMTVLTVPEIASSNAVAMTLGDKYLGVMGPIIPLGVAVSTFGSAMAVQFSVTRVCYVSAQEGHMPNSLSFLHITKLIPAPSVLLQGAIALCVLFIGEIIELLEFASFLLWISYACAMVSVLIFRRTKKDASRPFKAPIALACLVIVVSLFLCITPVVTDPTPKYFIALGSVILAAVVYFFVIYKRCQPKWMSKVTFFIQVILEVTPPENNSPKSLELSVDKKVSEKES